MNWFSLEIVVVNDLGFVVFKLFVVEKDYKLMVDEVLVSLFVSLDVG